jgi:hypothetical protein
MLYSDMYTYIPGLPDGLFSIQKYRFWYVLEGLGLKILVYFLVIWYFITTLVYFMAIWYFCGHVGVLFWFVVPRKIWQPLYIPVDPHFQVGYKSRALSIKRVVITLV